MRSFADHETQALVRQYLAAVLRSRRTVDRILTCVADLAERDEGCARALVDHPEALAALARSAMPAPWMFRAQAPMVTVRGAKPPAPPYLRVGCCGGSRRRGTRKCGRVLSRP